MIVISSPFWVRLSNIFSMDLSEIVYMALCICLEACSHGNRWEKFQPVSRSRCTRDSSDPL